jgi:hypothetical protein
VLQPQSAVRAWPAALCPATASCRLRAAPRSAEGLFCQIHRPLLTLAHPHTCPVTASCRVRTAPPQAPELQLADVRYLRVLMGLFISPVGLFCWINRSLLRIIRSLLRISPFDTCASRRHALVLAAGVECGRNRGRIFSFQVLCVWSVRVFIGLFISSVGLFCQISRSLLPVVTECSHRPLLPVVTKCVHRPLDFISRSLLPDTQASFAGGH